MEPTIDEIKTFTRLSPQMQWFQTYVRNIPDIVFLQIVWAGGADVPSSRKSVAMPAAKLAAIAGAFELGPPAP